MEQLLGKTALVTGASSGIGYAIARLFAAEGANVIAVARREKGLQNLFNEIRDFGGQVEFCVGDVIDEETARESVDFALASFGELDIAVNNAGLLGPLLPVDDISLGAWQQVMETNLTSAFLGAKYQIPALRKCGGGSLVFVSSFVGHSVGLPDMSAYSASKAGMIGLTKALSAECAKDGIRVNALLPGGTDTPMGHEAASTPEAIAFVENMHALKRMAKPEEIARSALYLASDNSSFTTGTALLADGGASINRI